MIITKKDLGKVCATFRTSVLEMTQKEVAAEVGYSTENVSAFENGRANNAMILFWYMDNGLTIDFFERNL